MTKNGAWFRLAIPAVMALAAVVSGCSKQAPVENTTETNELLEMPDGMLDNAVADTNVTEPENKVVPPPAEPVAPDQQMLEDAEATGMTARLPSVNAADQPDTGTPTE